MAEHPQGFDFVAVEAQDILENRQHEWKRFTRATTFAVAVIVLLLLFLLVFVA